MEYQMRNWYYFVWLCGDHIVEQHIHNLDVANWIMKGHPVEAQGVGGRQVRTGIDHGEIYDHHMLEYTYADGTVAAQRMPASGPHLAKRLRACLHGSQGVFADVSDGVNSSSRGAGWPKQIWRYISPRSTAATAAANADHPTHGKKKSPEPDPYQVEHDDLQHAIRNNLEYNVGEYGLPQHIHGDPWSHGHLQRQSGRQVGQTRSTPRRSP